MDMEDEAELRRRKKPNAEPIEDTFGVVSLECTIYFNNLQYTLDQRRIFTKAIEAIPFVPKRSPGKKILNGVSGYATPGKILAIIGSSGCGKTTLLNILSKRIRGGVIEGQRDAVVQCLADSAGKTVHQAENIKSKSSDRRARVN